VRNAAPEWQTAMEALLLVARTAARRCSRASARVLIGSSNELYTPESGHTQFSGAYVISRRSPELHPVEGRRGFFVGGLSSSRMSAVLRIAD
jgi:hypothetical protein